MVRAKEGVETDAKGRRHGVELIQVGTRSTKLDLRYLASAELRAATRPNIGAAEPQLNPARPESETYRRGKRHVAIIATQNASVNGAGIETTSMRRKAGKQLGYSPMRKSYPTRRGERYDRKRVSDEIERVRKSIAGRGQEVRVEDASAIIGCVRQTWYKKVNATGGPDSQFHLHDIDKLAVAWKAPTGWPFIPWELGEAFDRWRKSPESKD